MTVTTSGQGTVEKSPDETQYNHNETVTLTAHGSSDYEFDRWEGDLSGTQNTDFFTMNSDKNVHAFFLPSNEIITTPSKPSGPSVGSVNQVLTFSTGGAASNFGHAVEYRFDWGDGTRSDWDGETQSHAWSRSGSSFAAAQARCGTDTSVVSDWSSGTIVNITDTGIEKISTHDVPTQFQLSQNYPNPLNGETSISFHLPYSCSVRIDIFNVHGKRIATLANDIFQAGTYRVRWDGKRETGDFVTSGVYMYSMMAGDYQSTRTMLFLK